MMAKIGQKWDGTRACGQELEFFRTEVGIFVTKRRQKWDMDKTRTKWGQEVDRKWTNSGQWTKNGQKLGD